MKIEKGIYIKTSTRWGEKYGRVIGVHPSIPCGWDVVLQGSYEFVPFFKNEMEEVTKEEYEAALVMNS